MSGAVPAVPEVSVVIPCRNRTDMLRDCMRGLAAQTFGRDRFEVIVVDNCSAENLSIVTDEARAMGLNITLLRTKENRGPAPARNLGVRTAKAPIIAFTDSDCRPSPDWLSAGLSRFARPEIAFGGGPVLAKPEQEVTATTRLGCLTADEHPSFPTANLMMRRDIFLAHDGFDPNLSYADPWDRTTECADTDLCWRILKAGHKRAFEPRAIVFHEQEQQSLLLFWFDPSRLFVVPELVRRHPELRRELLWGRLVFYPPAAALYAAALFAVLSAIYAPVLLWLLPVALLARALLRARSLDPRRLVPAIGRIFLHLPRMIVTNLTLIYGSVRFRCLVL